MSEVQSRYGYALVLLAERLPLEKGSAQIEDGSDALSVGLRGAWRTSTRRVYLSDPASYAGLTSEEEAGDNWYGTVSGLDADSGEGPFYAGDLEHVVALLEQDWKRKSAGGDL
jgi:hypothetical protein